MTGRLQSDAAGAVVHTCTPDVARDVLSSRFARHDLEVLGRREAVDFRLRQGQLYDVGFHQVSYGQDVLVTTSGWSDFYLLQLTLSGVCELNCQKMSPMEQVQGSAVVINPGTTYRKRWSDDASQLIVRLPRRSVERIALPEGVGGAVLFNPQAIVPSADVVSLLQFLWSGVCAPRPAARSSVIDRSAVRHLVTVVLHSVPNSASAPDDEAPSCLLRADRYMRDHLAADLCMDEVAQACGVSTRTLQCAFQRHWRTTPKEHLRSLRLEEAHRLLTEEPGNLSVTEVAHLTGLPHLGRFSRYYGERFGEWPSESLRRSRQARSATGGSRLAAA